MCVIKPHSLAVHRKEENDYGLQTGFVSNCNFSFYEKGMFRILMVILKEPIYIAIDDL